VKITVAVCTWNRAALLDQTLERMRVLAAPPGATWELLVVNNNSTDDTDAVLARHEPHLPLRRLFEPKQGHSNARNCAVEHAAGDLLVWTDDDVLVEPDWLTEYAAAAAAFPQAGYFGGTVEPWFEVPPPRWVLRNLTALEGPFALRRLGDSVRLLRDGEQVFGANMAFRTELLRRFRFDPTLGRVGTGMLSGDDTELVDRVKADGWTGVWVGTARVRHYIPAGRVSAEYVWKFFRGLGRTNFRRDPNARAGPRLFGLPRWLVRHYVTARVRSLVLAPTAGRGWVNSFAEAATARGMIDEARERGPA
jgi:glycosyltransferase involved in cell wall biosynthesis